MFMSLCPVVSNRASASLRSQSGSTCIHRLGGVHCPQGTLASAQQRDMLSSSGGAAPTLGLQTNGHGLKELITQGSVGLWGAHSGKMRPCGWVGGQKPWTPAIPCRDFFKSQTAEHQRRILAAPWVPCLRRLSRRITSFLLAVIHSNRYLPH